MTKVAFDIGQVLCYVDLQKFINKCNEYGMIGDPMSFLEQLQAPQDVGLTRMEWELKKQEWDGKWSCTLGGKMSKTGIDNLLNCWNDIITLDMEMCTFVNNLPMMDVEVALLSNMGMNHASFIRENYPGLFENKVLHLSCEVGARKPSKLFFQSFLMEHPRFKGCLFVDDLPENLKRAELLGFRGYQFNLTQFKVKSAEERQEELGALRSLIMEKNNYSK